MPWFRLMVVAASLNGGAAWCQVNLPEGFELVELAESDKLTQSPRVNNCGEIVYVQDRFENSRLYLYDNGRITRLTDYDKGRLVFGPDINDAGTIVWMRGFFDRDDTFRIVRLRDGRRETVGRGGSPTINSAGHMSWQRFRFFDCATHNDIVYYDGQTARRIYRSKITDQASMLNDDDWIVWGHADFCVAPWVGVIPLYVDGEVSILPSVLEQIQGPTINNLGQVAWYGTAGIEIWESGQSRVVIPDGRGPQLNNLGDICFFRNEGPDTIWDAFLYRVSGGEPTIYRLTQDEILNGGAAINDWGEAVWRWQQDFRTEDGGLRFMRRLRTGESDFDGDVDLVDYRTFADCMTGPGRVDRLCDCRFLDIDYDGDVDLADFAAVQNGFTAR